MNENENNSQACNRRDFLKSGSFATMMTMLGGVELMAETNGAIGAETKETATKVKVGIIGLGTRGRDIVNEIPQVQVEHATEPVGEVAMICDVYPAAVRRTAKLAPGAGQVASYQAMLEDKDIQAVIIATPTHLHKEPVLAALKAGKHVYCEAPLANTIEDARAIALAAKSSPHLVFQSGLQLRSDPQRYYLQKAFRSGWLGQVVTARAQWHEKSSWRAPAPTPEREQELNWRLDKAVSLGLVGEEGIHQLDQAGWLLNANPVSITGRGAVQFWKDGREVPDTIHAMIEYPGGIWLDFDGTLVNSFDLAYEMFYGSDAAVMVRGSKAWMFKETDSSLLGWEIYARKESFFGESGIALVADASKSVQAPKQAAEPPFAESTLNTALKNFLLNTGDVITAEAAYKASYGTDDPQGAKDAMAEAFRQATLKRKAAGFLEGFRATVTAIKANEAVTSCGRVELKPDLYELG